MLAGKSTSEKPCLCFEVKILHFYGTPSEVQFLQLWNIQALIPLSVHAQADTQAVLAQSHHSPSAYQ